MIYKVPVPKNEPKLEYKLENDETKKLMNTIKDLKQSFIEIPVIVGGERIKTDVKRDIYIPHDHQSKLGQYYEVDEENIKKAIHNSLETWKDWSEWNWEDRVAIFLKAAELISGPERMLMNAATMLGQSKNFYQAEIDAAAETIDFLRFNSYYAAEIYKQQINSSKNIWNRLDYRPLEGFVFAIAPFNFTSISANLSTTPALVGNTVIFKPSSNSVYSSYFFIEILEKAGLPAGVINFIPGSGAKIGKIILDHPKLAGVHFTGSTETFQNIWKTIGNNISIYKNYPRIVGETGGKNFIFLHESANLEESSTAILRGAFEYSGQKCSAASRLYVPKNLWNSLKTKLIYEIKAMKIGSVEDFSSFINAVIDKRSFDKIVDYIEGVKSDSESEILVGGSYDSSTGYFIEPTLILTSNPKCKTMNEEIFGPVLTVYVYESKDFEKTLKICNETSPYGLTGSIFSTNRQAIRKASKILRYCAGNFYINDKPTGAVVGQQPFGGARASGTNDKAGSWLNLFRWISPRTIKENFVPPVNYRYN